MVSGTPATGSAAGTPHRRDRTIETKTVQDSLYPIPVGEGLCFCLATEPAPAPSSVSPDSEVPRDLVALPQRPGDRLGSRLKRLNPKEPAIPAEPRFGDSPLGTQFAAEAVSPSRELEQQLGNRWLWGGRPLERRDAEALGHSETVVSAIVFCTARQKSVCVLHPLHRSRGFPCQRGRASSLCALRRGTTDVGGSPGTAARRTGPL
jgi:hypothetical protein